MLCLSSLPSHHSRAISDGEKSGLLDRQLAFCPAGGRSIIIIMLPCRRLVSVCARQGNPAEGLLLKCFTSQFVQALLLARRSIRGAICLDAAIDKTEGQGSNGNAAGKFSRPSNVRSTRTVLALEGVTCALPLKPRTMSRNACNDGRTG